MLFGVLVVLNLKMVNFFELERDFVINFKVNLKFGGNEFFFIIMLLVLDGVEVIFGVIVIMCYVFLVLFYFFKCYL